MRALIVLLGLLALCAAFALPSGAIADTRDCESILSNDGYAARAVKTRNASCRAAQRLAGQVNNRPSAGGCTEDGPNTKQQLTKPCVRQGYRCFLKKRTAENHYNVRCLKGETQVIRWRV